MALHNIQQHEQIVCEKIFQKDQQEWTEFIDFYSRWLNGEKVYSIENEVSSFLQKLLNTVIYIAPTKKKRSSGCSIERSKFYHQLLHQCNVSLFSSIDRTQWDQRVYEYEVKNGLNLTVEPRASDSQQASLQQPGTYLSNNHCVNCNNIQDLIQKQDRFMMKKKKKEKKNGSIFQLKNLNKTLQEC